MPISPAIVGRNTSRARSSQRNKGLCHCKMQLLGRRGPGGDHAQPGVRAAMPHGAPVHLTLEEVLETLRVMPGYMLKTLLIVAASVVAMALAANNAGAELLSSRPITVVIPFTPGASSDTFQRLVAKRVTEST